MLSLSFVALAVASMARAVTYGVSDTFIGTSFLSGFDHQAISDPTHGRVEYVNQATAQSLNLTYANGNTFIIRADYTTTLSASGSGRRSVRIQSKKQWDNHVEIMDVRHMPQGCGTWPATTTLTDCNWQVNSNSGCGVKNPLANSYGPAFNTNGGGWYAMERTSTYIKVWFWPRNSATVPSQVKNGASSIDTSTWGTPFAAFVNTSCDINAKFGPNNIIINLTFCGDWAGSVYSSSGCPSTCVDYVNNNPAAFKDAYWDIAALRVYQ
ncbi:hypothetical protein FRC11_008536 [Ceratobasidium sp. 423]|nr:hypothetical protein FRC11_008536 [Ceratobasidium sp. 423]